MSKPSFTRPTFVMLYGFPGAGKTYFARQFADNLKAAHIQDDRLRSELFSDPQYDKQENEVIYNLMLFMAEAFLNAGISVIFDMNSSRSGQRRELRDMARRLKAEPLLLWLQIDLESAFARVAKRDRRRTDDKYTTEMDRTTFDQITNRMQNPLATENYIVISGKHAFATQQRMVLKRMFDLGIVSMVQADGTVAMPGLVNRVPNPLAGRVDNSRRNIIIR